MNQVLATSAQIFQHPKRLSLFYYNHTRAAINTTPKAPPAKLALTFNRIEFPSLFFSPVLFPSLVSPPFPSPPSSFVSFPFPLPTSSSTFFGTLTNALPQTQVQTLKTHIID